MEFSWAEGTLETLRRSAELRILVGVLLSAAAGTSLTAVADRKSRMEISSDSRSLLLVCTWACSGA